MGGTQSAHEAMSRGPKKHLKRLNAPKHWMLDKMGGVWAPVHQRVPTSCVSACRSFSFCGTVSSTPSPRRKFNRSSCSVSSKLMARYAPTPTTPVASWMLFPLTRPTSTSACSRCQGPFRRAPVEPQELLKGKGLQALPCPEVGMGSQECAIHRHPRRPHHSVPRPQHQSARHCEGGHCHWQGNRHD